MGVWPLSLSWGRRSAQSLSRLPVTTLHSPPSPTLPPSRGKGVGGVWLAATLLLAACSEAPPPAPTAEQALTLRPADARLAGLYEASCKACHAVPASGAPMVHDRAAWNARWKQGEGVLVDHTIQGYGAMPALGQCVACTPDDFQALIRFMAGREDR